jgi:site-specific DNA-methyltransferase (adenine-specific)
MKNINLMLDQIFTGDSIEVLKSIPEKSVDLIFADPPYNLQLRNELWRPNRTKVNAVKDTWDHFNGFDEYDHFTRDWLIACRRVLKDTGTIWVIGTYHNIFRVGKILQDLGYWILNDITWIKTNPMPNFRGVRFANAQETLIWAQKDRGSQYTFNYQAMKALNGNLQMRSDWYLPICTGKERIRIDGEKAHPTQKPEALLYRIILSSTNPGDIILDPFFGTGTTGAAAKKLYRHWIGIEFDIEYVQIAKNRIDEIKPQEYSQEIFYFPQKRYQPRIPFGALVERGMLEPGQKIYFDKSQGREATILANGLIKLDDLKGTIHQVAKAICETPCNGWEHWYFKDESTGDFIVLDELRQIVHSEITGRSTDQE